MLYITVSRTVPSRAEAEVADDAVLLRAKPFDGPLGAEIEVVRAQAHDLAAERVERMGEQQQLAGRVDVVR